MKKLMMGLIALVMSLSSFGQATDCKGLIIDITDCYKDDAKYSETLRKGGV